MKILKYLYDFWSTVTLDPFAELNKIGIIATVILGIASIILWIFENWVLVVIVIVIIIAILVTMAWLTYQDNNRSEYEKWKRRKKK